MNLLALALCAGLAVAAAPSTVSAVSAPAPQSSPQDAAGQMMALFMGAWSQGDANGLAHLFAPDGDFISPYGVVARGPVEIERFYADVFAHGYGSSQGGGDIVSVRALSPDIALIDAHWSIAHAKDASGAGRAPEKGTMVAVIGRMTEGWRILAIREHADIAAIAVTSPPAR